MDKYVYRLTNRQTYRSMVTQRLSNVKYTDRRIDRQIDRHIEEQTDRQTDKQTDRYKDG